MPATTTIVGFLAVVIGDSWWLIPFLGGLAFLQGSLSGASLAVANATIASMITAILFSVVPGSFQDAGRSAAWLCAGALIEIIVALTAWHWERQGLVRRQVGMALSARARGAGADEVGRWASAARVTMSTAELTAAERTAFDRLIAAAADGQVADRADLAGAGRRTRRLPTGGDSSGRFGLLVTALDCAPGPVQHRAGGSLTSQMVALRAYLSPGSASFQAGVRLAALMTIGAVLVALFDIPQGHWVLLVFALAVRADYSGTVAGLIARAAGVIAGVAVTSAVVTLTGGAIAALVTLALVAAVLTCRWLLGNAILFFLWLTVFVCVLVDIADPGTDAGWQRVIATLIGVAIGLGLSVAWPGWRRDSG